MARAHLRLPLLLLLVLPSPGPGQNVSLDEGAFRISLNGVPAGREEFSIRRTGVGDQASVVLRGSVEREGPGGGGTVSTVLAARGETLEPQEYQVRVSGAEAAEIYVVRSGSRFTARILSSVGEQLREYRAGPGSVLLEEGVAHHHFLLTTFLEESASVSVTVLVPRAGRQTRMTFSRVGEEEVTVGGIRLSARRYRLEGEGVGRDLWFDDQGRLLRVLETGSGYLAERESIS